jgi:hypothetical protein
MSLKAVAQPMTRDRCRLEAQSTACCILQDSPSPSTLGRDQQHSQVQSHPVPDLQPGQQRQQQNPGRLRKNVLSHLHTHLIRLPAWHVHASGRTRGSVIDLFSSGHVSSRSLCRNLRLKNPHKTTCLLPLSYCMRTMMPSVRHPRQGIFATAGVRIRTTPSVLHFR